MSEVFAPLSMIAWPFHVETDRALPPTQMVLSMSLTTIVLFPLPPVRTATSKMPFVFSTVAPLCHCSP